MRKMRLNLFAFIAILFCCSLVSHELMASTYYVATNGNDNNPGTISLPFATWQKGATVALPGDIVYIRGGVYTPTGRYWGMRKDGKSGTIGKPISIWAYPGETPILDCSRLTMSTGSWGIEIINSSYWHLKGLHIRGVSQQGTGNNVMGIRISNCNNMIIEQCEFYRIQGMGMAIYGASENNRIINCDSHDNYDPNGTTPGGDADGFVIGTILERGTPERVNYIVGCRAWNNSDDGFDFWENEGILRVDSCWAWKNGYNMGNGNGIKLGQANGTKEAAPQRYINNCLLFYNKVDGFDNSEANILMSFYNNTVYRNGGRGYDFGQYTNPLIFKNNISYRNITADRFPSATVHNHNSWDASPTVSLSDADFVSVDTTGVSGKRVNGKLPKLNFLKLATGSDLINAGTNVQLPYSGSAPDIGYNEFSSVVSSIRVTGIIVSGANGVKTISTARGTLQLTAAVTPSNATNKSVTWSIQNGTGQASVNSSGLVTAISNGTVTARATANDGSGIYGTLILTISNQALSVSSVIRSDGCSIVTARSGNNSTETPAKAFDNLSGTKWYNYNTSGTIWIKYQFCSGISYIINSYSIRSANDMPLRDPKTVSILGSNDGVNFTLLNTRTNIVFSSRLQKLTFGFTNTTAYQYYRLDMTASTGNDGLQVSEIELIENGTMLKTTEETVTFKKGVVTVSPNPFRDALTIDYNLPGESHVNLVVYDLNGMVVRHLVNEEQTEGTHRIVWDALNSTGNNLHSGMYILKMESAFGNEITKIIYSE